MPGCPRRRSIDGQGLQLIGRAVRTFSDGLTGFYWTGKIERMFGEVNNWPTVHLTQKTKKNHLYVLQRTPGCYYFLRLPSECLLVLQCWVSECVCSPVPVAIQCIYRPIAWHRVVWRHSLQYIWFLCYGKITCRLSIGNDVSGFAGLKPRHILCGCHGVALHKHRRNMACLLNNHA